MNGNVSRVSRFKRLSRIHRGLPHTQRSDVHSGSRLCPSYKTNSHSSARRALGSLLAAVSSPRVLQLPPRHDTPTFHQQCMGARAHRRSPSCQRGSAQHAASARAPSRQTATRPAAARAARCRSAARRSRGGSGAAPWSRSASGRQRAGRSRAGGAQTGRERGQHTQE